MSRPRRWGPAEQSPRLFRETRDERTLWWTETVGRPPAVYGERWAAPQGRPLRAWDPTRSKLAAALARGFDGDLPGPGERWLYLGAATGTTVSHVADLVGAEGRVYALERSVRAFARLLTFAERWPNVLPVLADARRPDGYSPLVPPVDGLYADIADPHQVEIVLANAGRFLRSAGKLLVALKTSSMGRERSAPEHLESALEALSVEFEPDRPTSLSPFHRAHYLVSGRPRRRPMPAGGRPPTTAVAPRGRRRR